jgi:hypothetical protein
MGGGGMGTLQALLTELSGLKKPRGFLNRYVRRLFGVKRTDLGRGDPVSRSLDSWRCRNR